MLYYIILKLILWKAFLFASELHIQNASFAKLEYSEEKSDSTSRKITANEKILGKYIHNNVENLQRTTGKRKLQPNSQYDDYEVNTSIVRNIKRKNMNQDENAKGNTLDVLIEDNDNSDLKEDSIMQTASQPFDNDKESNVDVLYEVNNKSGDDEDICGSDEDKIIEEISVSEGIEAQDNIIMSSTSLLPN